MYCPKKYHNYPALWDCEEDKCAWWNLNEEACAVLDVSRTLNIIATSLQILDEIAEGEAQIKVSIAK